MAKPNPDEGVTDTPSKTTGALPDRNPAAVRLDCVQTPATTSGKKAKGKGIRPQPPKADPHPLTRSKQPVQY